jgi:methylated-DNA-[protein]-cysteine S-methyltransferase
MTTWTTTYDSPIGKLTLAASAAGLSGLHFEASSHPPAKDGWREDRARFSSTMRQLDEYFASKRHDFDVALDLVGTAFQRRVWNALCAIPYGTTISYGELARRIGDVNASRAVGLANGRNPVAVIVPCHRVIGANGQLTGFGGGLPRKKFLLQLEACEFALVAS